MCNVYGATETGPVPSPWTNHARSPTRQLRLACARRAGAAGHEQRCGRATGPRANVVRHYWPERPAVDAEGWFHSGDLAPGRRRQLARSAAPGHDHLGWRKHLPGRNRTRSPPTRRGRMRVAGPADAQWGEAVVACTGAPSRRPRRSNRSAAGPSGPQRVARQAAARYVTLDACPGTALGKVQSPAAAEGGA